MSEIAEWTIRKDSRVGEKCSLRVDSFLGSNDVLWPAQALKVGSVLPICTSDGKDFRHRAPKDFTDITYQVYRRDFINNLYRFYEFDRPTTHLYLAATQHLPRLIQFRVSASRKGSLIYEE